MNKEITMKTSVMIGAVLVFAFVQAIFPATATQVSQFGVTWTFDKSYEVGQFVTGDYWIIGPATAPWMTRNTISHESEGAKPHRNDAMTNRMIEARNSRTCP